LPNYPTLSVIPAAHHGSFLSIANSLRARGPDANGIVFLKLTVSPAESHLSRKTPRRITFPTMISDTTLTNLSNGLGVAAMACIVLYHFIAVNGKRMEE